MKIRHMEIDSIRVWIWLEKPCDGYRWFWSQVERCYPLFLWHLQAMVEPPGPRKVLNTFYVTMMVFVIEGILNDSVSIPVEPEPEVD